MINEKKEFTQKIEQQLFILHEQYNQSRKDNNLEQAREDLIKLINYCEKKKIDGNYYYTYFDLMKEIADASVPLSQLAKEEKLLTQIKEAMASRSVTRETLSLAEEYNNYYQNRTFYGLYILGKVYFHLAPKKDRKHDYWEKAEECFEKASSMASDPSIFFNLAKTQLYMHKKLEAQ